MRALCKALRAPRWWTRGAIEAAPVQRLPSPITSPSPHHMSVATFVGQVSSFVRRARAGAMVSLAVTVGLAGCKETVANLEPVASINIDNRNITLAPTGTATIGFTLLDKTGAPLDKAGRTIRFNSSNAAVATVDNQGVVTGVATGAALITLSVEGQNATANVVVQEGVDKVIVAPQSTTLQVGGTQGLTVTVLAKDGTPLAGRAVNFQTSNAAVATVNSAGVILGITPGSATITTISEGKSATTAVTVTQVSVSTVDVNPVGPVILRIGTSKQFTATPKAGNGDPLTRTVTWSSVATDVATVSSTGLVTAVNPGSTAITAESEGKRTSVQVIVTLQPVDKVTVNGTTPIIPGQPVQFSVTLKDSADRVLSNVGRQIFWESLNIPVATVSGQGVVAGISAGTAVIQATVEGKTGQFSVTVLPAVASVTISPSPASVKVAATTQLTITARDNQGQVVSLTGRTVTWVSANDQVATVDALGVVTGVGAGTVTVTARVDGVPGSVSVNVTP
jgi:uncharacterized protein YjdB